MITLKIIEISKLLKAKEIYLVPNGENFKIKYAGAGDLMSDVLAFSKEDMLLITGLVSPQTITTAAVIGAKAILFVRGKNISEKVIEMAKDLDISVLKTDLSMYVTCSILFNRGIKDAMGTDLGIEI